MFTVKCVVDDDLFDMCFVQETGECWRSTDGTICIACIASTNSWYIAAPENALTDRDISFSTREIAARVACALLVN